MPQSSASELRAIRQNSNRRSSWRTWSVRKPQHFSQYSSPPCAGECVATSAHPVHFRVGCLFRFGIWGTSQNITMTGGPLRLDPEVGSGSSGCPSNPVDVALGLRGLAIATEVVFPHQATKGRPSDPRRLCRLRNIPVAIAEIFLKAFRNEFCLFLT